MKCFRVILTSLLLITLIACNDEEQQTSIKTSSEPIINNNSTQFSNTDYLPSLTFKVGEQEIKTSRGIYSWEFTDEETGELTGIKTQALPPFEIVNIENGIKFDLNETIVLNFDKKPSNFEIRIWNEKEVISTYHSFDEIKEKGKYAIEIVGYWDEGRVTYVCALEII